MISKNSQETENKSTYEFAEFIFDAENKVLFKDEETITLPPKACELLWILIKNHGRVVSRDDLLGQVWAETFVEEANLTHHISALRKALGEDKNGKRFIETIPRRGYRFVTPVSKTSDTAAKITFSERTTAHLVEETSVESPDDAKTESPDETVTAHDERKILLTAKEIGRGRKMMWFFAGLCLLATGAIGARYLWKSTNRPAFFDASTRSRWRVAPVVEGKSRAFGTISNISFAPNGKFIAFDQTANGKASIFAKQIGGGGAVRLTDGKWLDNSPVWSADGQRVAFISNRDNFIGVWAMPSFGGTPVLLGKLPFSHQIPTRLLKWSTDNNRFYYSAETKLYAQDLRDTTTAPILIFEPEEKFTGDFAISPDESIFAFCADADGKSQLFTRSMAGGDAPRQVTFGAGDKRNPAWFAGGRQIVFSSNESGSFQIYALDTLSGETQQLTLDAAENSAPAVSEDNRSILFHSTRDEANVYSLALENRRETALTASTGLQIFPRVAPDGSRVAFQTSASSAAVFESGLKILALDGQNQTLEIAKHGFNPQWSPDAASLAFIRNSGASFDLWKVSAFGQNETKITTDGIDTTYFTASPFNIRHVNFNWSPDGSRIIYASSKSGAANIWSVSADGTTEKKWTNFTSEVSAVSDYYWSPDEQKIVFFAQMKPPDRAALHIFRICITDGEQTVAIYETTSKIRILGWSQDGLDIYAAEQETNAATQEKSTLLLKIAAAGGKPQTLARLEKTDFDKPHLSPEAQKIIFTAFDEQTKSENLYLLPVSGGAATRLTDNREPTVYYSGVNFAPDGKNLFYSKQTSGDVYALLTISE